jgi:hypothetical protein
MADVSSSFSQTLENEETAESSGRNPQRRTTLHGRDGRNPSTKNGSRLQAPLIYNPLTQHIEHIPTQTEIIPMPPRLLKPGHQPSLKRRIV